MRLQKFCLLRIIGYNVYDVLIYCGKTESGENCTGSYAVLKLIETLPQHKSYKLFFDNWFCSLALCLELRQIRFLIIATIRSDRIKSPPLVWERDLKKKGSGAYAYRTDIKSGISVLKWYDNTRVQMCSNYSDPAPTITIKRWDRKENKEIEISCPSIVAEYNTYMGE